MSSIEYNLPHYKLSGTPNSPVLIFSNSLGSEMMMWDDLIPYLLPYFRILQYDTRGHGGSKQITGEKGYNVESLAHDVITLMDHLKIEKAYFCGLSLGGLIGQELAIRHSTRFHKIALSNTSAKIGDEEGWNERIKTIIEFGLEAIVDTTMKRWFTEEFITNNPEIIISTKAMFLRSDVKGYSHCCCAVRDADFRDQLDHIHIPCLIITGDEDPVTNKEQAEFLNKGIPNSEVKILKARHLSATELPSEFAKALIDFFIGKDKNVRGTHIRRSVLGNTHVDYANEKINDFNQDFQSFITQYAWGDIWSRPGLRKEQRSMITLAMLIALNRSNEFKMHIKAALNNGVSVSEIKEVIMQSAIYCGLPAANEAIHNAEEVFKTMGLSHKL
jgi:3-oxoadipate enol-lactonase / 4-carboxymuconolactone decarboxylase